MPPPQPVTHDFRPTDGVHLCQWAWSAGSGVADAISGALAVLTLRYPHDRRLRGIATGFENRMRSE